MPNIESILAYPSVIRLRRLILSCMRKAHVWFTTNSGASKYRPKDTPIKQNAVARQYIPHLWLYPVSNGRRRKPNVRMRSIHASLWRHITLEGKVHVGVVMVTGCRGRSGRRLVAPFYLTSTHGYHGNKAPSEMRHEKRYVTRRNGENSKGL